MLQSVSIPGPLSHGGRATDTEKNASDLPGVVAKSGLRACHPLNSISWLKL
jgi:hypothetical protein